MSACGRDGPRVIASLTSYPPRIPTLRPCLESILGQDPGADLVELCLSSEEFPHGRDELPGWLRDVEERNGLEVVFAEGNLRSHKKWFHALQAHPQDIVVLLDDDIVYPADMMGNLLEYHRRFPGCVISRRNHLMTRGGDGRLLPYLEWIHTAPQALPELLGSPRADLFATTGAGTLLFPGLAEMMPDGFFDAGEIMARCPDADDLWLNLGLLAAGIPVVASVIDQGMETCEGSQGVRLADYNKHSGGNDVQLASARPFFEGILGKSLEEAVWTDGSGCDREA